MATIDAVVICYAHAVDVGVGIPTNMIMICGIGLFVYNILSVMFPSTLLLFLDFSLSLLHDRLALTGLSIGSNGRWSE